MFIDAYHAARVGLAIAATGVGTQIATTKPPPTVVVTETGQKEYIQEASLIENAIEKAANIVENVDAKVVAHFLSVTTIKGHEVEAAYTKEMATYHEANNSELSEKKDKGVIQLN